MLGVSDNGCGMDEKTVNNIFEPFFTTKNLGKGTGLGLSTVYGIIKQNNGFINVYSECGYGTIFKMYFPKQGKDEKVLRNEERDRIDFLGNETVLIVEDESTILHMGMVMLEKLGYSVMAASTPREAIKIAEEHNGVIHLIISDVVMPEMNGKELINNIQKTVSRNKNVIHVRLYSQRYSASWSARRGE